jgi:hypothetical protein
MLIAKGLPMQHSQIQVTAAIHCMLGPRNVISVLYNRAQDDALGRHDGIATIRCLNSTVYTHWVNRCAIPLLTKMIDFVPHRKSLAGSASSPAAQLYDTRPACETLADAIIAMQNTSRSTPTLEELHQAMRGVEERIDAYIIVLGAGINSHTSLATNTLSSGINAHTTLTAEITTQFQHLASSKKSPHLAILLTPRDLLPPSPPPTILLSRSTTHSSPNPNKPSSPIHQTSILYALSPPLPICNHSTPSNTHPQPLPPTLRNPTTSLSMPLP